MIQVITDSAADLPAEIVEKHNITVVPLTVYIDGKNNADGIDISTKEFLRKNGQNKRIA